MTYARVFWFVLCVGFVVCCLLLIVCDGDADDVGCSAIVTVSIFRVDLMVVDGERQNKTAELKSEFKVVQLDPMGERRLQRFQYK